jgi:crotonobetainyl-CoA:carnitine CoA-transferase CaiB-like acyl-CoA transferase
VPHSAPLHGVTVVELTSNLSGPYAGMLLGDQGALVLKVERPGGDETRRTPPHYIQGDSVYFAAVNRNKRAIAIDAQRREGADLIKRLVRRSDVFLTNMRPRAIDKMGLGYATLSAVRPGLIYAHITGFGKLTSSANRPAFDLIVQAMGGTMSVTGDEGGSPCRAGLPIGDLNAGIFAAFGVSNALYRRAQTGEGAHLDVSMLGGQLAFASYLAASQAVGGAVARPHGAGQQSSVPYNRYLCADGKWLVIGAHYDRFFHKLLEVIGRPELSGDPRFADRALRVRHQAEMDGIVAAAIAGHDRGYWMAELARADVPSSAVNDLGEAVGSPEAGEAGLITAVTYPDGETLTLVADPVKFIGEDPAAMAAAPAYSQDFDWILRNVLAMAPAEISRLLADRVVFSERPAVPA